MELDAPDAMTTTIGVRPWLDPLVDDDGVDPRSWYVETFWLGVLGPTATWLLRRLAAGFDRHPDGYTIELVDLAREMGLTYSPMRTSPFSKALQRCVMFGMAHAVPDGIAVRRRVPHVSHRHLRRLPESLQRAHDDWIRATIDADQLDWAHRLAVALLEVEDDATLIEPRLRAIGVGPATAAAVADNAWQLRAS
jgi:hypothetical protein